MLDKAPESAPIKTILKSPESLKLKISPQRIKDKAIESHRLMSQMEFTPTPYMKFAQEVAKSTSSTAAVFQSLIDHSGQMADILPLSVTGLEKIDGQDSGREKLLSMRQEDIQNCSEQLKKIGISISPEELNTIQGDQTFNEIASKYRNLANEEGLINLVIGLQSEFFGILHATRSLEETRLIFEKAAPFVEWPKKDMIATTLFNDPQGDINGYYGLKSGKHIVMLKEPEGDEINYQMEANEPELMMTGKKAPMIIIAAHEGIGHAGFSELFSEQDATEVFEIGRESARRNDPRLLDSLNEGYAMYIEDIAIEASKNPEICEESKYVIESVESFQKWRESRLKEQKGSVSARIYPDGKQIINRLIEQLGVEKLSKPEQLLVLKNKLSTLDIKSMSQIKPENEIYSKCLEDPLANLPIKIST